MIHHLGTLGLCLGGLLLVAANATAQTVYVTDMLQLGLYPEPGDRGRRLQTLPSGTPLELLQRQRDYARVRTPEGTEGWAKMVFLVTEKPARARLGELETQSRTLSEALTARQEALLAAGKRVETLEERAASSAALAGESLARLEWLLQENQKFRSRLAQHPVPLAWLLVSSAASLVLGLVGGVWWLDRHIRRRHGGFRIY
ncbi:MAG: TIGR04211 family SH3 domain-containing protein [Gammaproteobacteria bacterium]